MRGDVSKYRRDLGYDALLSKNVLLPDMNAVQASLLCDDITKLILENLAPGPPVQSVKTASDVRKKKARHISQLTLARVARTCKGLSSTALDVLWREVDDLIHLLSVFPSFVKIAANQTTYVRAILPEDTPSGF